MLLHTQAQNMGIVTKLEVKLTWIICVVHTKAWNRLGIKLPTSNMVDGHITSWLELCSFLFSLKTLFSLKFCMPLIIELLKYFLFSHFRKT